MYGRFFELRFSPGFPSFQNKGGKKKRDEETSQRIKGKVEIKEEKERQEKKKEIPEKKTTGMGSHTGSHFFFGWLIYIFFFQ